ncbi:hypothetical protein NOVO_07640 [Rickettsiales bacterium Ac37b]|nr:hypothetical protein NOVO_07640 [Rickettsiales bacterium Ac37b]
MAKAKTASKNNPVAREKAKEIFFNGKKVKPVLYIGEMRKYMAVQYEDGTLAFDTDGNPTAWSKIKK